MLVAILTGCSIPKVDPGFYGPFDTAWTATAKADADADATGAWRRVVYFPTADGTTIDPEAKPAGIIVFGPGLNLAPAFYRSFGEALASHGYVTVIPYIVRFDNWEATYDYSREIDWLLEENDKPGSFFYQALNPDQIGATGHSMGAKYAVMSLITDDRIGAAVSMEPTDVGSSLGGMFAWPSISPEFMDQIEEPLLLIGGEYPTFLTPVDLWFHDYFVNAVGPTQEVQVLTATHPSFIDDNGGPVYDIVNAILAPEAPNSNRVLTVAQRYMVSWFNVYLRGETEFETYLTGAQAQQDVTDGLVLFDTNF